MKSDSQERVGTTTISADAARGRRMDVARMGFEVLYAAIVCSSAMCFSWVMVRRMLTPFDWKLLGEMIDGRACTPFQYRIFMPEILGLIQRGTGAALDTLTLLALFAGLVLVGFGTRLLIQRVHGSRVRAVTGSLVGLVLLGSIFTLPLQSYFGIADIPSIVFFTGGLYCIFTGRLFLFYLLFVAATLNRETSCFLSVAFLLAMWGRVPRRTVIAHVSAQAAIWLLIKSALYVVFKDNITTYATMGGVCVWMVQYNFDALTHVGNTVPSMVWGQLLTVFGGLWLPLVWFRRNIDNEFVRRILFVIPVHFAGMCVVGDLYEPRIFADWLPFLLLGLTGMRDGADGSNVKELS